MRSTTDHPSTQSTDDDRPEDDRIAPPGLKGLVVADTALGDVRGDEGFYHYRQYSAPELARRRSLEDVWLLLLDGHLPDADEARAFREDLVPLRRLPDDVSTILPAVAATSPSPAAALRTALSHLAAVLDLPASMDATPEQRRRQALRLSAAVPTLIAALHRLRDGRAPLEPDDDLPFAADYLYLLHGAAPAPATARALEQYLILGIDHGFNASTFTARVITSTGADLGAAVVGALGALTGPLHGGAPSRALDTLDAIGDPANARPWVTAALARGERIMGFGHAVYRTADPRSELLREVASQLGGELVERAIATEREIEAALATARPDRVLRANVEWYAAVVMERCGIPRSLFTSTFAASRVIGWCAHALEQAATGRLIRPSSRYVGPTPPVPVPDIG